MSRGAGVTSARDGPLAKATARRSTVLVANSDPTQQVACVALGSNLGDREATLRAAMTALGELPQTELLAASRLYETEPVGPPGQNKYLNAAARLATGLHAAALLDELLALERRFGRARRERWGPRTLDLDIILFGDETIDTERLTVPHPHFRERLFVLTPLAEVAASLIDPLTDKTVGQLLEELEAARPADVEPRPRPL
jgi:2-amino-4-hydroxy-6-hydroxymethyldihydropteridine diphosphokinase